MVEYGKLGNCAIVVGGIMQAGTRMIDFIMEYTSRLRP